MTPVMMIDLLFTYVESAFTISQAYLTIVLEHTDRNLIQALIGLVSLLILPHLN